MKPSAGRQVFSLRETRMATVSLIAVPRPTHLPSYCGEVRISLCSCFSPPVGTEIDARHRDCTSYFAFTSGHPSIPPRCKLTSQTLAEAIRVMEDERNDTCTEFVGVGWRAQPSNFGVSHSTSAKPTLLSSCPFEPRGAIQSLFVTVGIRVPRLDQQSVHGAPICLQ